MHRIGNGAILIGVLVVVAAGAGVAMSPDVAQDILPPSMLPMLPQFEKVQTDRSCDAIEKGTEFVNKMPLEDVSTSEARQFFCKDKCELNKKTTVGTVCTDNKLGCICRK